MVVNEDKTIALNEEQKEVYNEMLRGANICLSGDAGTGKSTVIMKYINDMENLGKEVLVVAPTGIAAINIGGTTVHRAFKAPIGPIIDKPKFISSLLQSTDIIVADEISMCRIDLFDFMTNQIIQANLKRRKKGTGKGDIQIILSGDFFQLPPVIVPNEKTILTNKYGNNLGCAFAFNSENWNILNFKVKILHKVMRQTGDTEFIKYLNNIRIGENVEESIKYITNHSYKEKEITNAIMLCGKNKDAQLKNDYEVSKLLTEGRTYIADISGEVNASDKMTQDELQLKVGCRIMTLVNNDEAGYSNGSLGEILNLRQNSIVAMMDDTGEIVEIERYTWDIIGYRLDPDTGRLEKDVIGQFTQIPVKVAYAITIHKSQGQTYDAVNLKPYCWDYGQMYVALSRVRSLDKLHISGYIDPKYVRTSTEVKKFYAKY